MDEMPAARQARIAGLCYFLVIGGGVFAALFVRESLFVLGDAGATARNIAANQTLWRWGIAVHALYLFPGAAIGVILYRLFKVEGPTLALLALVFAIVPVGIEAVLLTALYAPLPFLATTVPLGAFDEGQRDALVYLAVRLFQAGWGFSLLLFSGFCTGIGLLILRSSLVPRFIGVLMVAAGISYFTNGVSAIVSPPVNATLIPWILLPSFVGEFSLAIWLTFKGVKPGRGVS